MTDEEFVAKLIQELEDTIAAEGAGAIAAMIAEPCKVRAVWPFRRMAIGRRSGRPSTSTAFC